MRKIRGFKLGRRLVRFSRWIFRQIRNRPRYQRLGSPESSAKRSIANLLKWGRKLTMRARSLCNVKPGPRYLPIGSDPVQDKPPAVPKGHLAVYVGQKDGEFHRVLVPVIYFNHPLFMQLLKEAEEEYGFDQKGTITIPCHVEEFRYVQGMIAREKSLHHNHHHVGCFGF